jgi:orotidine-5'-phosphate decarboxylase
MVVAVTVLTSLDTKALFEMGVEMPVDEQVRRLARLAEDCGIDGVVCSPREIQIVRKVVDAKFKVVTPGIRLPDQSVHDQQRIATPREALSSGADYIVVGRAVTDNADPRSAMLRLLNTL